MDLGSLLSDKPAFEPAFVAVGLAAFLAGAVVSLVLARRDGRAAPPSAEAIVRDLCALNGRLAGDATLAGLVVRYVEAPERLDRVERIRARAWFDAARRLHGLLADALDRDPGLAARAGDFAPSMGEGAGDSRGNGVPDFADPPVSNVTLIDPEFMAWVQAMKSRRRT